MIPGARQLCIAPVTTSVLKPSPPLGHVQITKEVTRLNVTANQVADT